MDHLQQVIFVLGDVEDAGSRIGVLCSHTGEGDDGHIAIGAEGRFDGIGVDRHGLFLHVVDGRVASACVKVPDILIEVETFLLEGVIEMDDEVLVRGGTAGTGTQAEVSAVASEQRDVSFFFLQRQGAVVFEKDGTFFFFLDAEIIGILDHPAVAFVSQIAIFIGIARTSGLVDLRSGQAENVVDQHFIVDGHVRQREQGAGQNNAG